MVIVAIYNLRVRNYYVSAQFDLWKSLEPLRDDEIMCRCLISVNKTKSIMRVNIEFFPPRIRRIRCFCDKQKSPGGEHWAYLLPSLIQRDRAIPPRFVGVQFSHVPLAISQARPAILIHDVDFVYCSTENSRAASRSTNAARISRCT